MRPGRTKNRPGLMRFSAWLLLSLLVLVRQTMAEVPAAHADSIATLINLAHQGDADAAIALARRYDFGIDVPVDKEKTAQFYCQAALAGRMEAARRLALMFMEGEGVERDHRLADQWLNISNTGPLNRQRLDIRCSRGPAKAFENPAPSTQRALRTSYELMDLVRRTARQLGIDPALAIAVVASESGFRVHAVSPRGAEGLMQLMPATARELGVHDSFDPEANILGGLRYLKQLLTRYQGNESLALAAYNAGMRHVDRTRDVPEIEETQLYVQRVLVMRSQVAP